MSKELWLKRIRNVAGLLGMILPWIALIGAFLAGPFEWSFWKNLSISETYYVTPALAAILTSASVVLLCYDGYELRDNIITTASGIFGMLIVLFPCDCGMAESNVGYFQINVEISNKIHCFSAAVFFVLLAINSLFLFTLGESNTEKKKKRNLVYRTCGIGMIASMLLVIVPISFPAKTFVVETLALSFFGVSWLVKGGFLGILVDDND